MLLANACHVAHEVACAGDTACSESHAQKKLIAALPEVLMHVCDLVALQVYHFVHSMQVESAIGGSLERPAGDALRIIPV